MLLEIVVFQSENLVGIFGDSIDSDVLVSNIFSSIPVDGVCAEDSDCSDVIVPVAGVGHFMLSDDRPNEEIVCFHQCIHDSWRDARI